MDAPGLIISAALCTVVFVIFDRLVRLVGGAVGEVRYTVAPTLVGGLHAWLGTASEPRSAPLPRPLDDDQADNEDPRGDGGSRHSGLVIPLGRVRAA